MKKLFLYLLKIYSKSEKQRLEILNILNEKVQDDYTEQTAYGNVYNSNIEFIMGNKFIRTLIEQDRIDELNMIKEGLTHSTEEAIKYIKTIEPRRKKLKYLKQKYK